MHFFHLGTLAAQYSPDTAHFRAMQYERDSRDGTGLRRSPKLNHLVGNGNAEDYSEIWIRNILPWPTFEKEPAISWIKDGARDGLPAR